MYNMVFGSDHIAEEAALIFCSLFQICASFPTSFMKKISALMIENIPISKWIPTKFIDTVAPENLPLWID